MITILTDFFLNRPRLASLQLTRDYLFSPLTCLYLLTGQLSTCWSLMYSPRPLWICWRRCATNLLRRTARAPVTDPHSRNLESPALWAYKHFQCQQRRAAVVKHLALITELLCIFAFRACFRSVCQPLPYLTILIYLFLILYHNTIKKLKTWSHVLLGLFYPWLINFLKL